MVRRHVVWYEIEDQAQPALMKHGSGDGESLRPTEVVINDIAAHAVRGADVILRRKVRQGSPEVFKKPLVLHGDFDSSGTALPDAHQPNGVKAKGCDPIPLIGRHRGKVHGPLVFPAHFTKPDPGVYLVNDRVFGPCAHRLLHFGF